jgi:hypothetical protein
MPNPGYGVTRLHFDDNQVYAVPLRYVQSDQTYPLEAERLPGIQQAEYTVYGHELTARQFDMFQMAMMDRSWPQAEPLNPQPVSEETLRRREAERSPWEEALLRENAAKDKALETLTRMLNPEQLKTFNEDQYFEVRGSEGHRFKIYTWTYSGNVEWIDKTGRIKGTYCCHPLGMTGRDPLTGERGRIPTLDAVIAQKLMLETDEIGFMRTTVVNWGGVPKCATAHAEKLPERQHCLCPDPVCARYRQISW